VGTQVKRQSKKSVTHSPTIALAELVVAVSASQILGLVGGVQFAVVIDRMAQFH
jgi:hypothetical protein